MEKKTVILSSNKENEKLFASFFVFCFFLYVTNLHLHTHVPCHVCTVLLNTLINV